MTTKASKPKVEKVRICKDCDPLQVKTPRPAPHPGPRCFTCHIAVRNTRRKQTHDKRVVKIYGLTAGEYDQLYELQGGKCYICERATGRSKRLAVDHNHETNEVRGLLCTSCNKNVIGHLRDSVEALQRAIDYLNNPPARRLRALAS